MEELIKNTKEKLENFDEQIKIETEKFKNNDK